MKQLILNQLLVAVLEFNPKTNTIEIADLDTGGTITINITEIPSVIRVLQSYQSAYCYSENSTRIKVSER